MRLSAILLVVTIAFAPLASHAATEAEIRQFFTEFQAKFTQKKLQAAADKMQASSGGVQSLDTERKDAQAFVERYYAPQWTNEMQVLTIMEAGGLQTQIPAQKVTITREQLMADPTGLPQMAPGTKVEFTRVELNLVDITANTLRTQALMEMLTTTPQGQMRMRVSMPCTTHFSPASPAQIVKDECESITTLKMTPGKE